MSTVVGASTQYEIVAVSPDRKLLLAYTARHSRDGIIAAMRRLRVDIDRVCGDGEWRTGERSADGITCGKWVFRFTGRTEREVGKAILPWIHNC